MKLSTLREDSIKVGKSNQKIDLGLAQDYQIKYYPKSYNEKNGISFIIGTIGNEKSLFLISGIPDNELIKEFEGNKVENSLIEDAKVIKKCPLNQKNSEMLQKHFEFTRPKVIGLVNSFGFELGSSAAHPVDGSLLLAQVDKVAALAAGAQPGLYLIEDRDQAHLVILPIYGLVIQTGGPIHH